MVLRLWAYLDVALSRLTTKYKVFGMVSLVARWYDDPDDTSMEYKVSSFFVRVQPDNLMWITIRYASSAFLSSCLFNQNLH